MGASTPLGSPVRLRRRLPSSPCSCRSPSPAPPAPPTRASRSATTAGRRRSYTSTSASTSPGTGSAPTRCTRSPATRPTTSGSTPIAGNPEPMHKVGFTFTVVFTQPGVYQFHCKLHNVVHGEVIVSDTPGNPNDDPDPIPKPNVNLSRPLISGIHLSPKRFGTRRYDAQLRAGRPLVDRRGDLAPVPRPPRRLRRLAGTAWPHRLQLRIVRPAERPFHTLPGTLRRLPHADRRLPQRRAHPAARVHDPGRAPPRVGARSARPTLTPLSRASRPGRRSAGCAAASIPPAPSSLRPGAAAHRRARCRPSR